MLAVRLNLGEMPKTLYRQTVYARKYRRDLEAAVEAAKGEINLTDAHYINEAAAAEMHGSICQWLLRERMPSMSNNDILTCSRELVQAKRTRNRAMEKLGLDRDDRDTLAALYTTSLSTPPGLPPVPREEDGPTYVPGSDSGPTPAKCANCNGTGRDEHLPGVFIDCPECKGSGNVHASE